LLPTLSQFNVSTYSEICLHLWSSFKYFYIPSLHLKFQFPPLYSSFILKPSFCSLRLFLMNNACSSRITATAGTRFVGTIQKNTVIFFFFIEHVSCSCYLTGSNFRSLSNIPYCCQYSDCVVLFSIPLWLIILSDQLRIIGLISSLPHP
jgi:hypothetical protein